MVLRRMECREVQDQVIQEWEQCHRLHILWVPTRLVLTCLLNHMAVFRQTDIRMLSNLIQECLRRMLWVYLPVIPVHHRKVIQEDHIKVILVIWAVHRFNKVIQVDLKDHHSLTHRTIQVGCPHKDIPGDCRHKAIQVEFLHKVILVCKADLLLLHKDIKVTLV